MKTLKNYRPKTIDFTIETSEVPMNLGEFENPDTARVFMAENFVTIQGKNKVTRFMDGKEKQELRIEYGEKLEAELPELKRAHYKASQELELAKSNEKAAQKAVEVSLEEIQTLANDVKRGTTEIDLDAEFTWEVIYNNKKYIYTYMDKEIKLADIVEIRDFEKNDLLSSSGKNERFFEKLKKVESK